MYVPDSFSVTDPDTLTEFMRTHSFATLVSLINGTPTASHLPIRYEPNLKQGRLLAHMARANPQWRHFEPTREVMVIFQGAHSYISPSWYATQPAVPTWNYAAVHAYGLPRLIDDPDRIITLLQTIVASYESEFDPPWSGELPQDYRDRLIQAIVVFELQITRVEGKFKFSQNRDPSDIQGVISALKGSGTAERQALAKWMQEVTQPRSPG